MAISTNSSLEHNQPFWQLALITGGALGLPGILVGGQLSVRYGPSVAIYSVIIGNFILWAIGLVIISMTGKRENAIENVRSYLGKKASRVAALVWVLAFIIWFSIQVQGIVDVLSIYVPFEERWILGTVLGLLVALISTFGIRGIKMIAICTVPWLIAYACYAALFFNRPVVPSLSIAEISLSSITSVSIVWLPGTVSLPTFFRHARSSAHAVLGLSLMVFIHIVFQICAVYMKLNMLSEFLLHFGGGQVAFIFSTIFSLLFFLVISLVNIYYAASGWESIFPRHRSSTEYFLIGLIGTLIYCGLEVFYKMQSNYAILDATEKMLGSFIACLGVVLVVDYLIKLIVRHRPRPFDQFVSTLSWFMGCITAIALYTQESTTLIESILSSISASAVFFLIILFFEETIWSLKSIYRS